MKNHKSVTLQSSDQQKSAPSGQLPTLDNRTLQLLLGGAGHALIVLSKEKTVEYWDGEAEKTLGYSTEQALGKEVHDVLALSESENFSSALKAAASGQTVAQHQDWLNRNGDRVWLQISITALRGDGGLVSGYAMVVSDNTNEEKLKQQIAQQAALLQRKTEAIDAMNRELASFVYVSSHDLQEPLRKIQTFSSRIMDSEGELLSSRGKDYFLRMQNAAARMQILIDDLLVYSRTNTADRTMELTDLHKICRDVVNQFSEKVKEHQCTVTIEELPMIEAIVFQVRQLFTSLIGNALKYSRPNETNRIYISAREIASANIPVDSEHSADQYLCVTVADQGIGFDQDNAGRIFQPFQKLHGRAEYDGSGMGLAICKRIMENHRGFIFAEGKTNVGASFHACFPIKKATR